jgi:Uma2 family endonuclease
MMDAISTPTTRTDEHPHRMTWEEWLAWAPDSRITEWVDGEVIEMSPISQAHDAIFRWFITVLEFYVYKNNFGEIRAAPFVLKLSELPRGREPDLMFIAAENAHRIHPTYVDGPADAVWEIVSPESVVRDWHDKYREYETEGVREYWVIDPQQQRVELYRLGENRRYASVPFRDGKLESAAIPGFYVRPEWLWNAPMPKPWEVLPELGVL